MILPISKFSWNIFFVFCGVCQVLTLVPWRIPREKFQWSPKQFDSELIPKVLSHNSLI